MSTKLISKLVAMTPYQLYLNQVKCVIEPIRFESAGMDYIPPQLGGMFNQRDVISKSVVLQIVDFEVN